MLKFITLLFLGILVLPSDSVIIKSQKTTNDGDWNEMNYCPPDMYAVGWEIKSDRSPLDITALNGVALYCEFLNSSSYTNRRPITSGVGPFGEWRGTHYCENGKVIVGFDLSYWTNIGFDDIGATDFTALCGDPLGSRDPSIWSEDGNPDFYQRICPKGYAVSGIQTQVEEEQGAFKDDNGLNNVKLHCHKIKITCTHEFVTLFDYSNSGSTPVSRSFTERTAHTHKSSKTTEKESSERTKWHAKLSADILTKAINAEIGWEYETITTQKLISMVEQTIHQEKEEKVEIQIPPKSRTIIKQLHIICGDDRLGLPMITRKEQLLHNVDHHKVDIRCTHMFMTLFHYYNSGISAGIEDSLTLSINAEIKNEFEKITTQKLISMVNHTIHHEKE
ncbi:hypothetical protein FO519_009546, partial [Halicephalobus sp. NKZ332]